MAQSEATDSMSLATGLWVSVALGSVVCGIAQTLKYTRPAEASASPPATYAPLKRSYITSFLLATSADWMMGPYLYALYESYGYDMASIGTLFVFGYGASLTLGTYFGTLADKLGRKLACIWYCLLMILGAVITNSNNFQVLAIGRVFGGVATSLLYSAFESWIVCAISSEDLPPHLICELFSAATFGNALIAILAGFVANGAAMAWGLTGPFNLCIVPLLGCLTLIQTGWKENYGNTVVSPFAGFQNTLKSILEDRNMVMVGFITMFFEGAMYLFVFIWTPALNQRAEGEFVHLGLIFAGFMIWKMTGSACYVLLERRYAVERFAWVVFALAALGLAAPLLSSSFFFTLAGFNLFELAIGMYWPTICTLRAQLVPEAVRSTTINIYRIPLNAIVIITLFQVGHMSDLVLFWVCTLCCVGALFAQQSLRTTKTVTLSAS
eukprot:m.156094 g.156094  ORF g.156094 m.156094 type:complete len:439 (-) comp52928_c0_seq3:85-1401(-)